MKDQTPQGKKSPQHTNSSGTKASPPPNKRPQNQEDVDFDILDALDQLNQIGGSGEPEAADNMMELTLDDDDDSIFGEEASTPAKAFRFDENLKTDLEEELLDQDFEMNLDEPLDEEQTQTQESFVDDAFQLDLNAGDDEDLDLGLDEGLDLNLNDDKLFENSSGATAFDAATVAEPADEDFALNLAEPDFATIPDLDTTAEAAAEESDWDEEEDENAEISLDTDTEETVAGATEFDEFDLEASEEGEDEEDDFDFDDEEGFDLAAAESDELDLGSFADEALTAETDADLAEARTEFHGKPVIAVGADEVIDLGAEDDLERADVDELSDDDARMLRAASEATSSVFAPDIDLDLTMDDDELASEDELETELDEDEGMDDFMNAADDLDGDLEAEATKVLEDEFEDEEALPEDTDAEEALRGMAESDTEDDLLNMEVSDDEAFLNMGASDVADEAEFPADPDDAESEDEEWPESDEMTTEALSEEPPADLPFPSAALVVETEPFDEPEPAALETSPETASADWASLGISLRLGGEQMQEFEGRLHEARTLQHYLDELGGHSSQIKAKIYQKLQHEYIERKTAIFSDTGFITVLADVEHDLQDMLEKRAEFAATLERLKEELEEINVRHLVGEYDDAVLTEKQTSQKADMATWNQKAHQIERVIVRYQTAIDSERLLNPLRTPAEAVAPVPPKPESAPVEPITDAPLMAADERKAVFPAEEEEIDDVAGAAPEDDSEAWFTETPEEPFGDDEETAAVTDTFAQEFLAESDEGGLLDDDSELDALADEFGVDSFSTEAEATEEEPDEAEEPEDSAAMVTCKKCGRQTAAAQKFCAHCGGKAQ